MMKKEYWLRMSDLEDGRNFVANVPSSSSSSEEAVKMLKYVCRCLVDGDSFEKISNSLAKAIDVFKNEALEEAAETLDAMAASVEKPGDQESPYRDAARDVRKLKRNVSMV